MNYSDLLTIIAENITSNNQKAITGLITRNVLTAMVNSLGAGYQFMGFATTETNPGTPDQRVFYIAIENGTYQYFNNLEVTGLTILYWSNSWSKQLLPGGGSGSVQISNVAQTGTRIFTITIDGVSTDIKAPTSGGSTVQISNLLSSGTRIATFTVDGVTYTLRAPSSGEGSSVRLWPLIESGTKIAIMEIDGYEYSLYAPNGGGGAVVTVTNLLQSGTRVATITIDDIVYNIRVPDVSIEISNLAATGDRVATISINGVDYEIRVPKSVTVSIGGTDTAPTLVVNLGNGVSGSVALPIASATKAGIVSTVAQTFAGAKTFDRIYLGNSASDGAYIEWDDNYGAFKIVGNVYSTGQMAAGQ